MGFNAIVAEEFSVGQGGLIEVSATLYYVIENPKMKNDGVDLPYYPIPISKEFKLEIGPELWNTMTSKLHKDLSLTDLNHILNRFLGDNKFSIIRPPSMGLPNPPPMTLSGLPETKATNRKDENEWQSFLGLTQGPTR